MTKASLGQGPKLLTVFTWWEEQHCETFVQHGDLLHDITVAIHEDRLPPQKVRALIDAHTEPVEKTPKPKSRVFKTGALVNRLIRAGYHTVARAPDGTIGMTASVYKKLWPKEVEQPAEYTGRFDGILLVDVTISQAELVSRGKIDTYVEPAACTDLVPAPTNADGTPIVRYVAFVQLGEKNLKRTVEDCTATFASDEVGLVTTEGLHLPVQHETYLRKWAVDLAGSRSKSLYAPCVRWFAFARPKFVADDVRNPHLSFGSASRGSKVIAVS